MSTPRDTPFSKPNSDSQYGKTPLESWVGTVVSYDKQKEQIEAGWGWRYKVRIMGDNTNSDQITDEQLSYAYVLLPTTAGSGGAFKMRSVRISQGDFVYGVRGGGAGAPTMILGVFPRTRNQKEGTGNFKNSTGFYGSLNSDSEILDGEFNEQTGPGTPGTDPVGPKNYNKAEQREPSDKSEQLGVTAVGDENVDVNKKLTPKKMLLSLKDYAKNLFIGEDAVNSEENLDKIIEDVNKDKSRTNTEIEVVKKAIDTSVNQNLIEEEEANNIKKEIDKLEVVNVNDQGIILNSEAVRDGLLTYVDGNGKQFVKFTSSSGEVTFEPADEIRKSAAKTAAYNDRIENEDDDVTFERVVDNDGTITFKSSSKETSTSSSSVNITYDEETNTFTSTRVTTSSETLSGLVVGSEAPKNDNDIKLRLTQNSLTISKMINLYDKVGNKEKSDEAKKLQRELKNFIKNNPSGYDGSSLQATLKSKYGGINY